MNHDPEAIARRNTRCFIAFRLLFNARFYYPVFAIIFLDFGISLKQFALLNAIWAATIILAEVPSGALSDLFGRKKLLVGTAVLMVMEMSVWAFAPTGNPTLLFGLLAVNRVLSGLGEASASGSDEALVYESLENAGRKADWSRVLEIMTKWKSFAFVLAMIIGGFVYDSALLSKVTAWFGYDMMLDKRITLRLPLYLTLLTSVFCLITCLGFIETKEEHEHAGLSVKDAFRKTLDAGRWIIKTPFALVVILAGAFADSMIRIFVTLGAEYYRLIQYPEYALGFIGAGLSMLNFVVAPASRKLVDRTSPGMVFGVISVLGITGFWGASLFIPLAGLLFVLFLYAAFSLTAFALSYYLNRVSDNAVRATVLSFKGMALNLGYGFIGLVYAGLLKYLENSRGVEPGDDLFIASTQYFTPWFAVSSLIIVVFTLFYFPKINRFLDKD
jgi:MFS family permease